MITLPLSLQAWGTASFDEAFKQELCSLGAKLLPLQQGLQHSSYAISDRLAVTILNQQQDSTDIIIRAGLFYHGIIAGCSCSDDPTPTDETVEYCDVQVRINLNTAETTVVLI